MGESCKSTNYNFYNHFNVYNNLNSTNMKPFFKCLAFTAILLFGRLSLKAQPTKPDDKYSRTDEMIPMRDGVKLHTVIYTPKQTSEKLPFLLTRTPYGVAEKPS